MTAGVALFLGQVVVILGVGPSWWGALLSNTIQLALGILTILASWQACRRCGQFGRYFWSLVSISYAMFAVAQAIGTYGESFHPGYGGVLSSFLFFAWFIPIGLSLMLPEDLDARVFDGIRVIDVVQVVLFWTSAYLFFRSSRGSGTGSSTTICYFICYGVLTAAFFLRAWTTGSSIVRALTIRSGLFLLTSQGISALYEYGPGKGLPCGAWFDLLWSLSVLVSLLAAGFWDESKIPCADQRTSASVNRQVIAELFSLLYPLLTLVLVAPSLHAHTRIGSAFLLSSLACTGVRLLMTQRNLVIAKEDLRRDLSARWEAEQALRESAERFRGAFDFAAIGMAIVSPVGRWLRVNRSLCNILGYSNEELLAADWQSITHPDDLEIDLIVFRKLIEGELPFIHIEKRYVHKTGKVAWVMVSASLVRDAKGDPMYSVVQIQNITQRKEAEEAHRQSEERFAKAFGSNPEGIVISTLKNGRILEANEAYVKMMGYAPTELIGRTVNELAVWNPGEREEVIAELEEKGLVRDHESTFHMKGGGTIQARISMEQIQVQDERCILTSVRDVTESRLMEKRLRAAQKLEAIGRLAGGIAHDFNNLLMIISGAAELMKARNRVPQAEVHYLDQIESATERGAALTRQLLAFSRQQVLNPIVLNLNGVVEELWKLLPRLLGEDVESLLSLAPHLANVNADRSQLEQVIMNLCVNARDAMPNGGKLLVETANVELDQACTTRHGTEVPPGSYVMLAVTDTGVGMDANTQARIFEPFFTTKELGKGTGLGLATVYGIVKQSEGYIWVYSEPGKGTSFKVYLPAVTKPARVASGPEPVSLHGSRGETVLIVEDQTELREVASSYLASRGYKVLEAGNREEALRICREHDGPVHVMLTDVVLPGGGGPDLAKAALKIRPDLRLIYMSGYTDRALGIDLVTENSVFLQKPFNLEALARALCKILEKSYGCQSS